MTLIFEEEGELKEKLSDNSSESNEKNDPFGVF